MKKTFTNSQMRSPMKEGSKIRPSGSRFKKGVEATITLTSLIDAFVILVLYLVVASSPSDNVINIDDNITLPQTKNMSEPDGSPIVTFKQNGFYIDDQRIAEPQLKDSLRALAAKFKDSFKNNEASIVIQADENIGFEKLQPVLIASSHAGIKHVKFAVLQKD